MHRRPNFEPFPFDPEIERTLSRVKKIKADNTKMEDQNTNRFSEGQSDHNEMPSVASIALLILLLLRYIQIPIQYRYVFNTIALCYLCYDTKRKCNTHFFSNNLTVASIPK